MGEPKVSIEELLSTLYDNVPEIYGRCIVKVPNKKGLMVEKKCIINYNTGDVFPRRTLAFNEAVNYTLLRRFSSNNQEEICHPAFRHAQVIDDCIVLATWVFADYINYPTTSKVPCWWYNDWPNIDDARRGPKQDENALINIVIAKPQIASMIVVTKDKTVFSWDDIEHYGFIDNYRRREVNEFLSKALTESLYRASDTKNVCGLPESFKKFFTIGYAGSNKYVTFDSHTDVPAFMRASKPVARNGAKQDKVNELASIALPNHTIAASCHNAICYADRVNEEWAVLRWWHRSENAVYFETSRLYVSKNDVINCRSDLNGNWVFVASKLKSITFNADSVILQTDDVFDGTKLEYFKNISTTMKNQSEALYMLTMYPEFEKMYKIGMSWLCNQYLDKIYQCSWKNHIEERLGKVDWKAKNIHKMIGLNRHQVEAINNYMEEMLPLAVGWRSYSIRNIVEKMKNIFHVECLNDIDNAKFDYILDSLRDIERVSGGYYHALVDTFAMYPNDAMFFIKDLNNVVNNAAIRSLSFANRNGRTTYADIDGLYGDTIRMISSGNYTDVLRPRFSTLDELIGHHQVMLDLVNADAAAHAARVDAMHRDGFTANYDRWTKWEWDKDDTFCVVAPTAPIDVAEEGITLRHCVKSYIPDVANGKTNIVFIRRKDDKKTPFFTVEIDNHNNIRQVHGFGNSNASTVNGLIAFIDTWAKSKKLHYSQVFANGIRAAGY